MYICFRVSVYQMNELSKNKNLKKQFFSPLFLVLLPLRKAPLHNQLIFPSQVCKMSWNTCWLSCLAFRLANCCNLSYSRPRCATDDSCANVEPARPALWDPPHKHFHLLFEMFLPYIVCVHRNIHTPYAFNLLF